MDNIILDIDSNEEQVKKEPVKLQNKYLYNDYFQKTAKLWKEYVSKLKLFEKINSGRIFLKNGTPSYYEIYKEPRLRIMRISEQISILYALLDIIYFFMDSLNIDFWKKKFGENFFLVFFGKLYFTTFL